MTLSPTFLKQCIHLQASVIQNSAHALDIPLHVAVPKYTGDASHGLS
jgi:hypothetical protein